MNRHVIIAFCLAILVAGNTRGQQFSPPSPFTIENEFSKHTKQHPYIRTAEELPAASYLADTGIVYHNTGSSPLKLDVFMPASQRYQKHPAIILIHGGGWQSGNRRQHHALAQRLALRGFVVITPEYRLSGEAKYPAALEDINTVRQWIGNNAIKYSIDTSRVALMGFSAGGQIASLVGATQHKHLFTPASGRGSPVNISAVVNMDGILAFVHPESGEGDDSKKISAATQWFGVPKSGHEKLWQEAGALAHVSDKTPPSLFINSGVARMHAGRDDFIAALNNHGIYNRVKTIDAAVHSFPFFHPWIESIVTWTNDFLQTVFNHQPIDSR